MRTARSSSRWGGLHQASPDQTPPGADPPGADPPAPDPRDQTPPWEQTPLQEQTPLWTELLIHACENITLPQTSFAGGNNNNCLTLLSTNTNMISWPDRN